VPAASQVRFNKIPLGDLSRPVSADELNRVQQAIQDFAATIPGPASPNVVNVDSDYQVTGNEDVIHVNAQAGPVKITLLDPSSANRPLTIKQVNVPASKSSPNAVTVATRDGSKTIAGIASFTLGTTGTGTVTLTSDGQQHWPDQVVSAPVAPTPANPSGSSSSAGLVYTGIPPIIVSGRVISFQPQPTPPTPPAVTPWIAPVPFGDGLFGDQTGSETWQAESMVDFTSAPSQVTAYWWFQALSSSPGGVFKIRIGGSAYQAINGAVAASWTEPNATMTARSVPTLIAPPAGIQRVTLTATAPAGGNQKAQIQGVNLQFR
jgi:hypothetical protein